MEYSGEGPLDPQALDEIVDGLDLQEASALDRLQHWYQEVLRTTWDWVKKITGGEEGWLQRLGDWITTHLGELAGGSSPSAETILTWITNLTAVLVVAGVGLLLYRLWRQSRPLQSAPNELPNHLLQDEELRKPLEQLPLHQWAPALLSQVCLGLVARSRLELRPDSTNEAIAQTAQISSELKVPLRELTQAADRALFAGWVPNEQEIAQLRTARDKILRSLVDVH